MGLSSAMRKFRARKEEQEQAEMDTREEENIPEPDDNFSDSPPVSDLDNENDEDEKLLVIEEEPVEQRNESKDQLGTELVTAAANCEWSKVDELLRRCKRYNLNVQTKDTGETTLMIACKHSRFLLVSRLCDLGAMMNLRCNDRRTALHYAASQGHEEIVRILLRKNADPNLLGGPLLQLPLHIASSRGAGAIGAAHNLLKVGLRNSRLVKDARGNIPITYAVRIGSLSLVKEMLRILMKEQMQWKSDYNGDYLVHIAARTGKTNVMTVLGRVGQADMNVRNNDGQTPLHISSKIGDDAMVRVLQNFNANADVIDKKERTALHVAAEYGHTVIVEILVEKFRANVHMRTKDGSTLMHLAAEHGYADTVLAFIKRGVPLHMPNKSGTLCLHAAAANGHVKVVKTLIKKGSPVDVRTKDGYTALHLAVLNGQPEIIQVLLGFGAKVDLRGGLAREAPLHIAARMPEGLQCAEMLLKSGAVVNNQSEETWETPLHVSARYGFLELLKMLLEEGADPMHLSKSGESALHIAVRHCHFEIAKAVINFVNSNSTGRDATNLVNLANNEGETCFHLAAELGKSQTHHPFEDVDIIRLLLDNGVEPLTPTRLTHETSLHYCARSGNPDVFQEIVRHLTHGFQSACNRKDRMGWSALMTSCNEGHSAIAEVLLDSGARADVFDEVCRFNINLFFLYY